jgi:hypothetical protein
MLCVTANCGCARRPQEFSKGGEKYGRKESKEKEEIMNVI